MQAIYQAVLCCTSQTLSTLSPSIRLSPSRVPARELCSSTRLWHHRLFSQSPRAVCAPGSSGDADVQLDPSAVQRLQEVLRETPEQVLRLSVDSGGCSGFQYNFSLDQGHKGDDIIVEQGGVALAVDKVSMEFLRGATIEYAEDLLSSSFRVKDNPIAEQSCGCGSSFAAKMDWN